MYIFIDESGTFSRPPSPVDSFSAVGALVLKETSYSDVRSEFGELKQSWGVEGEVKGSSLDESQVSSVIRMLKRYGALFDATVINQGREDWDLINQHKLIQADKLVENLTDDHQPSLIDGIREAAQKLRETSDQLYVQSVCANDVVYRVIQHATLHFALNSPTELAAFHWEIDGKDKTTTPFEELWTSLIGGMLQSQSAREGYISVIEGDYSHFEKYHKTLDRTPDYLIPLFGLKEPFHSVEIGKIWKDSLRFLDSNDSTGVQLCDILVSTVRRALQGNLNVLGWATLGGIMYRRIKGQEVPAIITLTLDDPNLKIDGPNLFTLCHRYARELI